GQSVPLVPPFGAVFVAWDETASAQWLARAGKPSSERKPEQWGKLLETIRRQGYSVSLADDRGSVPQADFDDLLTTADAEEARRRRDELVGMMQHGEYLAGEIDDNAVVRLTQISAPVFDATGRAAASLMLLGPQRELTGKELNVLAQQVAESARRAGRLAGGGNNA
ncbi:hypothetical protein ACFQ07_24205, partial [Actinomadura adrarensis]